MASTQNCSHDFLEAQYVVSRITKVHLWILQPFLNPIYGLQDGSLEWQ